MMNEENEECEHNRPFWECEICGNQKKENIAQTAYHSLRSMITELEKKVSEMKSWEDYLAHGGLLEQIMEKVEELEKKLKDSLLLPTIVTHGHDHTELKERIEKLETLAGNNKYSLGETHQRIKKLENKLNEFSSIGNENINKITQLEKELSELKNLYKKQDESITYYDKYVDSFYGETKKLNSQINLIIQKSILQEVEIKELKLTVDATRIARELNEATIVKEIKELKEQFNILMPHSVVKNSEKIDKEREVLRELFFVCELIGGYVLTPKQFTYIFEDKKYKILKDKLGGEKTVKGGDNPRRETAESPNPDSKPPRDSQWADGFLDGITFHDENPSEQEDTTELQTDPEWEKVRQDYFKPKEVAEPLASSASHTEQYCDNCTKQNNYDIFQCPGTKCIPERDFIPKERPHDATGILVEKEDLKRWSKVIIRFLKKYQPTLRSLDAFMTVKELKKYLEEDKE